VFSALGDVLVVACTSVTTKEVSAYCSVSKSSNQCTSVLSEQSLVALKLTILQHNTPMLTPFIRRCSYYTQELQERMSAAVHAVDTACAEGDFANGSKYAHELLTLCNTHLARTHAFTTSVHTRVARICAAQGALAEAAVHGATAATAMRASSGDSSRVTSLWTGLMSPWSLSVHERTELQRVFGIDVLSSAT
jgi:hypothetical protein